MSEKPQLTHPQAQIVERVARGLPDKAIAHELKLSVDTVRHDIQEAAARLPRGDLRPRHQLTLFFLGVIDSTE
jgi:DNA-binding NarL/FixJ family response regulator